MAHTLSVLIIDDSAEVRIILTRYLKNLGFETITTADDGRSGLEMARSSKPNIVILDGVMPEMDGLRVLPEIKKEGPRTVVIICSSLSDKTRIMQFKNAGADFYLLKPFSRDKFDEMMRQAIEIVENQSRSTS